MNNRLVYIVWLLLICFRAGAESYDSLNVISSHSFIMLRLSSNWLSTSNPAGLSHVNHIFPSEIKLGYFNENGDYKKVQQGRHLDHFQLSTQSYQKFKNTVVYGAFGFDKKLEHEVDYTQVNQADFVAPYLLIDTIGGDVYDREFYTLNGGLASPLSKTIFWGIAFDYKVGLAAQDRDPRPQNKVMHLEIRPGLLFRLSNFKLGFNAKYAYYNEDIESEIVRQNVQYAFFQTHGLGRATYHVAGSYYRLYQMNTVGAAGQIEFKKNNLFNLSEFRVEKSLLKVDDGRKGGDGSWASVKHDAQLEQQNIYFQNSTIVSKPLYTHRIAASFGYSKNLGQEYIMRLEQEGETDLEHWKLYAVEDKYSGNSNTATLDYVFMGLQKSGKMSFLLKGFVNYYDITQKYYQPDLNEEWSGMAYGLSAQKVVELSKSAFTFGGNITFGQNLSGEQNVLTESPVSEKLLIPDFIFLTADYQKYGGELAYELNLNNVFNSLFMELGADWYKNENNQNRTLFHLHLGVVF